MGTVKSKGERLNWPLVSETKNINSKEMLANVKGRVLSEDDLIKRRGQSLYNNTILVP